MGLTHKEYLEKVEMSKVYMSLSKYVCEHDLFQQIKPEPILTVLIVKRHNIQNIAIHKEIMKQKFIKTSKAIHQIEKYV